MVTRPIQGNPGQYWIPDSIHVDSGYGFQRMDSEFVLYRDSGFQELDSRFQCPVFRIPQAKVARNPEPGFPYMGLSGTICIKSVKCFRH